jgi:hypothetical protein
MALTLALALVPLGAAATPAEALLVARTSPGTLPRDQAVVARLGERVEVFVLVRDERGWFGAVDRASVGGRRITVRPWRELGATRVTWRKVEPRMRAYTNARLFGPQHGSWRGYAAIEYFETRLDGAEGPVLSVRDSRPSDADRDLRDGLGTLRWAARVSTPRGEVDTPGAAALGPTGIDPRVLRVSFRGGDDLPGWMAAFFNVPQVFGSAGGPGAHQTDRFVGADCADVVVGALRASGRRIPYTNVAGLSRYARPVTDTLRMSERGGLDGALGWDRDLPPHRASLGGEPRFRRGDIVLIDYVGAAELPRPWDHVGVLVDDDGDGLLDGDDRLAHMGLETGLSVEPLRAQGATRLRVLRLRPRYAL